MSSVTNLSTVLLPGNVIPSFSCTSNAGAVQRITITIDNQVIATFNGAGENIPMKLSDGKNMLTLPNIVNERVCVAKFEYSDSNGKFSPSRARAPVITGGDGFLRTYSISASEASDDDINDSILKIDLTYNSKTNPTKIILPKKSRISITSMANAAYTQYVACRIDGVADQVIFSGKGENIAMTVQGGKDYYDLEPAAVDRTLIAVFSFAPPGQQAIASTVETPVESGGAIKTISVSSEDRVDNDKNDSVLRVVVIPGSE